MYWELNSFFGSHAPYNLSAICAMMAAMKRHFLFFAAVFFLAAKATPQSLPQEILSETQAVYEWTQSDGGQWIFVSAASAADGKNRLYSFEKSSGETRVLFEPFPDTRARFVYGMHFWPKTQKLYFMVHCGDYKAHGSGNLFLHEGLHTAQKDSEQKYSAAGVWRHSALEGWLFQELWTAYIQSPARPDYDVFLNALYTFADPGTNPIFALQKDDGAFVYGAEALEWLLESGRAEGFLNQVNKVSIVPLEKYLFRRDKDGNVLKESAVTIRERDKVNAMNIGMIWTETTFAEANESLYAILMKGSFKDKGLPSEKWTWDYSLVFEITDDQNGLRFFIPEALKEIYAVTYSFNSSDPLPIKGTKGGLLIRDADKKTKWLYDGINAAQASKGLFNLARKGGADSATAWLIRICAGLVFVILLLLLLFYEFLKGRFSVSWQRRIAFQIQEEERGKISRDIHDSIVQDIRAIRIEAEMLKVQEGQEQKQSDLIEKITDCIVRMRNICYGLEPAEFSLPSAEQKINLLSILNSLAAQFEAKSKIKCSLNAESAAGGNAEEILVEKEKCQNLVRIVQEALANIEKHSYATEAQILARTESQQDKKRLALFIIDNGRGCDLEKVKSASSWRTHFGIRQMKERAKSIGAEISFRSAPDDGMQIKISVEI